jgi:hypothetical protein
MEIQTRRQILEIWRATLDYSYRDGKWTWGGRKGRNSISDAEQLLTILYPSTVVDSLRVDSADRIADDVLEHLSAFGNALDIPRQLVRLAIDYMRTYVIDGTPDFSGDLYFDAGEDAASEIGIEQRRLHVVDSYSMSVTLCLSVLGFTRTYRQSLRSSRMIKEVDELDELASQRLTAAMVGLLRSFTVNTFDPGDQPGVTMCEMINQTGVASEILVHDLLSDLAEVRAGLRQELSLGLRQVVADELENIGRMFECGWSWGVIQGAPEVDFASNIGRQPTGVANARPYLYFTVVALDGIQDLFSERTRILSLLNEEQQRLARALQLRWDLTRQFWAKLATFGTGRWPLEDLPWTTSDGEESDYYSVLLTSIVLEGIGSERVADIDVERIGRLLEELGNRGRLTRRPTRHDPAVELHVPGIRLRLIGSEDLGGPRLLWLVSSYSMLVLKRLLRVAELLDDSPIRSRFLELADQIWAHLERRKMDAPTARGLWDEPTRVFTDTTFAAFGTPSWYHTERVIEALVAAANVTQTVRTTTVTLTQYAQDLLAEAEHLFDRERLRGTSDAGEQMRESFQVISVKLRRARELVKERPGTAGVLATDVLRDLDMVDAARQDTARMT